MSDFDEFKTPRSHYSGGTKSMPKISSQQLFSDKSDEESTGSDIPSANSKRNSKLTLVAEFDQLMKYYNYLPMLKTVEKQFMLFAIESEKWMEGWIECRNECQRLRSELDMKLRFISTLENNLDKARLRCDQERDNTKLLVEENRMLREQIQRVKLLLFNNDNNSSIPYDTREKLSFLKKIGGNFSSPPKERLNTIAEGNTTGSLLSDLSFSCSENDSLKILKRKSYTPFVKGEEVVREEISCAKKVRRSSTTADVGSAKTVEIGHTDKVVATTTLTVHQGGPILATSIIESIPNVAPPNQFSSPVLMKLNQRSHTLMEKTVIKPNEYCSVCKERFKFGRSCARCKECKASCHLTCQDKLPLPCIPCPSNASSNGSTGVISDYVPKVPPFIPALVIHCINEVESRGLNEIGIYRISASEAAVKNLKAAFLKGKGRPSLKDLDIHVVCATLKDFLRSLHEPLVTYSKWKDFVRACKATDPADIVPTLYQVISEIPAPNRDTLAFVVLHLQKVSRSVECKMNLGNLAKVFGPTIIGYSSEDLEPNELYAEVANQQIVMEQLLKLPMDYWESLMTQPTLQQTPSTDSLATPMSRSLFGTPHSGLFSSSKRQRKFFPTPPAAK